MLIWQKFLNKKLEKYTYSYNKKVLISYQNIIKFLYFQCLKIRQFLWQVSHFRDFWKI